MTESLAVRPCERSFFNPVSLSTTTRTTSVNLGSTVGSSSEFGIGNDGDNKTELSWETTKGSNIPNADPIPYDDDDDDDDDLAPGMPWTDFQKWALRDNLPRYLVSIPVGKDGQHRLYALWRSMIREVVELSGYHVEFVREMHSRQLRQKNKELGATASSNNSSINSKSDAQNSKGIEEAQAPKNHVGDGSDDDVNVEKDGVKSICKDMNQPPSLTITPDILPLLDEFQFEPNGGVSGRAYGIPGIASGSFIQTSCVVDVEQTVPMGYIRTQDGTVAYELGLPAGGSNYNGLEQRKAMLQNMGKLAASMARDGAGVATTAASVAGRGGGVVDDNGDAILVRLGGVTAALLAGATAVNMLSHHLTVNVFWV